MSVRKFIGASSALLLTWLLATFLHQVPAERYPKQSRPDSRISKTIEPSGPTMIATVGSSATGDR